MERCGKKQGRAEARPSEGEIGRRRPLQPEQLALPFDEKRFAPALIGGNRFQRAARGDKGSFKLKFLRARIAAAFQFFYPLVEIARARLIQSRPGLWPFGFRKFERFPGRREKSAAAAFRKVAKVRDFARGE